MKLLRMVLIPYTRQAEPTLVKGRYVAGAETSGTILGNLQPAPATVLEILSEADRERSPKRLFTKDAIQIGDVITHGGYSYEITQIATWDQPGLSVEHYDAIALRIEEPEGRLG